jgi:guanylate kinase
LNQPVKRGTLLVVSGPSGVGKSSVVAALAERMPFHFSVSWTTRERRPGEQDGRDYVFADRTSFEDEGAGQVKRAYPEAVLVFILPPSMDELERRLRGRGDTSDDDIQRRLSVAQEQIEHAGQLFDYLVTNTVVDTVADEIVSILTAVDGS